MCERNMGIEASKEEMATTKKGEIEHKLRMAYLVILRGMEGRQQISFAYARNSWMAFTKQVNVGELLINQ